ncbi:hypothetical protein RB597_010304 [Gaeumannomyces tritici]
MPPRRRLHAQRNLDKMLLKIISRRDCLLLRSQASRRLVLVPRRGVSAAPKPGFGPLMERRANRELPNVEATQFRWMRIFPIFLAIIGACSVAIFNYQKMSSPVVASTLYALRVSPEAREYLGDEIYFKQQIPWISGEINQLHGRINISFAVKGTRRDAIMHFASNRPSPKAIFETTEWSLELEDGSKIDLLASSDPFRGMQFDKSLKNYLDDDEEDQPTTRGFRQMNKK